MFERLLNNIYGWFGGIASVQTDQQPNPNTDKPVKPEPIVNRASTSAVTDMYMRSYSASTRCGFDPPPPLTIGIMWRMRADPAVVLASAITTGPIMAGTRSMEVCDDHGNKDLAEKMQEAATKDLLPTLARAMHGACESLHFSNWLEEVEWDRRDNRMVPVGVHSFLPGEAIIHQDTGKRFTGFEVNGQVRDSRYAVLFVNEPHIDPVLGYSRNQNALEQWWRKEQSYLSGDRTERKASGISMMMGLPSAQTFYTLEADGVTKTPVLSEQMGQSIVNGAAAGDQVFTVPTSVFPKEAIENNPALANIPAVTVQPFSWGDTGPQIMAQLARADRCDRDIMRSWHRPEREATEGQHGTKAEAGAHGQVGITDTELLHAMYCDQWDRQVTRRWELTNYGAAAVGTLRTKPAPLADAQQAFLQRVWEDIISGQMPDAEALASINVRALGDRVEVPMLDEGATAAKLKQKKEDAAANAPKMSPANGQPANGEPANGIKVAASANGENGHGVLPPRIVERMRRLFADDERDFALAGDAEGEWRTLDNGVHVLIKNGVIVQGPAHLIGTLHTEHQLGTATLPNGESLAIKSKATYPDGTTHFNEGRGQSHWVQHPNGAMVQVDNHTGETVHDPDVAPAAEAHAQRVNEATKAMQASGVEKARDVAIQANGKMRELSVARKADPEWRAKMREARKWDEDHPIAGLNDQAKEQDLKDGARAQDAQIAATTALEPHSFDEWKQARDHLARHLEDNGRVLPSEVMEISRNRPLLPDGDPGTEWNRQWPGDRSDWSKPETHPFEISPSDRIAIEKQFRSQLKPHEQVFVNEFNDAIETHFEAEKKQLNPKLFTQNNDLDSKPRFRQSPLSMSRALSASDDGDGVWRTINGAPVFIKDGVITKGPHALIGKTHGEASGASEKPKPARPGFEHAARDAKGGYHHPDAEIHARLKSHKLPPGWKDVQISADPESEMQAIGKDSKNRTQYRYSTAHNEKASAEKFVRVKKFVGKLPEIREKIATDPREEAAVLRLVDNTGFRIGSEANTGADKQAFGATTLHADHIHVSGDEVHAKFTGKKGVDISQKIASPQIADELKTRAKSGGKLYNTTDAKVRGYLHEIAPGYKVKDFRTAVATDTAMMAMATIEKPQTMGQLLAARKQVATVTSAKLGNTPTVALKSYIPPEVFAPWNTHVANTEQAKLIGDYAKTNGLSENVAAKEWIGKNARAYREDFNRKLGGAKKAKAA